MLPRFLTIPYGDHCPNVCKWTFLSAPGFLATDGNLGIGCRAQQIFKTALEHADYSQKVVIYLAASNEANLSVVVILPDLPSKESLIALSEVAGTTVSFPNWVCRALKSMLFTNATIFILNPFTDVNRTPLYK